jgi:hypothetical protein
MLINLSNAYLLTFNQIVLITIPSIAAAAMMYGSCIFLYMTSTTTVAAAIIMVGISINDLDPRMITAPAMAPIAAAVIPSTKALMPGRFPYFLK